jgi:hypothetical protein
VLTGRRRWPQNISDRLTSHCPEPEVSLWPRSAASLGLRFVVGSGVSLQLESSQTVARSSSEVSL